LPGEGSQEIAAEWRPLADISETNSEYLIKAELPEVEKKDVNVTVNDSVITIKGELRLEKDSEDEMQHRIESLYGSFLGASVCQRMSMNPESVPRATMVC